MRLLAILTYRCSVPSGLNRFDDKRYYPEIVYTNADSVILLAHEYETYDSMSEPAAVLQYRGEFRQQ